MQVFRAETVNEWLILVLDQDLKGFVLWRFSVIFRMVSHIVCCTAHYNFLWAGGPLVFAADVFIFLVGRKKMQQVPINS